MNDRKDPWMDPPVPAKADEGSPRLPKRGSPLKGAAISERTSAWANSSAQIEERPLGDGQWRKAFRKARGANAAFAALEAQSSTASTQAGKPPPDQDASSLPSWARGQTQALPVWKPLTRFESRLAWLASAAGIASMAGYALMARLPEPSLSKLGSAIHIPKAAPWMAAAGILALAILALGLACQWGRALWPRRALKKTALSKPAASVKPIQSPRRPKPKP